MGEPSVRSEQLSTSVILLGKDCQIPLLVLFGSIFKALLNSWKSDDHYFRVCIGVLLLAISSAAFSKDESGYSPQFNPVACPEEDFWLEHHALQCGTVAVPHSYDSTSNGFLDVMVYRLSPNPNPVKLNTPKLDTPMVYINGGPGASFPETHDKAGLLSYMMPERELIFYELRGMVELQSDSPCPVPEQDDDNQFSGRLDDANGLHAKRVKRYQEFKRDCTIEFLRKYAIPGEAFHIENLAGDVESIRAALKIEQWDVMAHSFGPTTALELLRIAPANTIRSLVLSAPGLPLNTGKTDATLETSYTVAAALQTIFAACEQERTCRKQYPQMKDQFLRAASQLMENPLIVSSETTGRSEELDAARFIGTLISLMDSGRGADMLPAFISLIEKADSNALAHLFNLHVPEQVSEDTADNPESSAQLLKKASDRWSFANPLYTAMECNGSYTFEHIFDEHVLDSEIYNLLADYNGRQWIGSSDCDSIVNPGEITYSPFEVPESNVPVLLLAGGIDPRTLADYAVWLSTQFPTATLLLDPQNNHGIDSFNSCIGLEAVRFLEQPAAYKAGTCAIDSELHIAKQFPEKWVADSSNPWVVGQLPQLWFKTSSELFGASHHGAEHYTNMRAFVNFQLDDQADEKVQDNARKLLLSTSKNPDMPAEHEKVLRRRIGDFTWTLVSYYDEDFDAKSWIAWRRSYSSIIIGAMTTNESNPNRALKNLFDPFLESLKPCINFGDRIFNKLVECQF